MKSKLPKVMAEVLFKPMSDWVISSIKNAGAEDVCIVTGYNHSVLEEYYKGKAEFAYQSERLGTGHAVMQASDYIKKYLGGYVLVAAGDNPLISENTIRAALSMHEKDKNFVTIITAEVQNPAGYGRIVRNKDGSVLKIVEHKDCSEDELKINEVNSSWYIFNADALLDTLGKIKNDNAAGEYYLTDAVGILINEGKRTGAYKVLDSDEILGANDRIQLLELNNIARMKVIRKHLENGVTINDLSGVSISPEAVIGPDTVICKGTTIKGKTVIGEGCLIGPDTVIESSTIGNNVTIIHSIIDKSSIGDKTTIGPYSHLRPNSNIGSSCRIGNFVEIKNSNIADRTKVAHLTYIGDTDCGSGVNFGCGTITANYDGKNKFRTKIGDNVFVGCNASLVAPVTIEDNSIIAAGSTITNDVPKDSLAIARARQINKNEWAKKRKEKFND